MSRKDKPGLTEQKVAASDAKQEDNAVIETGEISASMILIRLLFWINKRVAGEISDKIKGRLMKLAERIESCEISEDFEFDISNWLNYSGKESLTRSDLGRQVVILTSEEFKEIGVIEITQPGGGTMLLDPDDFLADDILIIYPQDLGE